jgi:hypothetical protein
VTTTDFDALAINTVRGLAKFGFTPERVSEVARELATAARGAGAAQQ